ncbi:hypothetical protein FKM82_027819 [Ascaphus truei]
MGWPPFVLRTEHITVYLLDIMRLTSKKTRSLWSQQKVFFICLSLSLLPWRGNGCCLSLFQHDRHGRGEWVSASIETGLLHGSRWHNAVQYLDKGKVR